MVKGFKPPGFGQFYNNSWNYVNMIAFGCHLQWYVGLMLGKSPACVHLGVYIERQ